MFPCDMMCLSAGGGFHFQKSHQISEEKRNTCFLPPSSPEKTAHAHGEPAQTSP